MKFRYVDESVSGNEAVVAMVGIIIDGQRMRKTKDA
jgi:hypothetical protein